MTPSYRSLHEDAFYAHFLPYRHKGASCDVWGGHGLETFGADLKIVMGLDRQHLWTVVEGTSGRLWTTPGLGVVNRICHLVTRKAHHWIPASFRVPHRPTSLTPVGLRRQLKKIEELTTVVLGDPSLRSG